jgi:hypothetical protein
MEVLELKVNKKQAEFIERVCENKADFIDEKTGLGWQTGFRATFQGGRGSGKTNALMRMIAEVAHELPRAKIALASLTYGHVQNVVLSQSRKVWAEYGLHEYHPKLRPWGHYVINRKPPEDWDTPLEGMQSFENVTSFVNGVALVYVSADRPETARGHNFDVLLMDESFMLKHHFYDAILRKTVRANKGTYKDPRTDRKGHNHPLHWLIADFTSGAWIPAQQWIYITEELQKKYPERYYFLQANVYDNIENLPGNWIQMEREAATSDRAFRIEVLNERVNQLPNSFYSAFDDKIHTYFQMSDYVWDDDAKLYRDIRIDYQANKPLDLGLDFNAMFTSLLIAQQKATDYLIIKSMFVKQSKSTLVEQIANDFCDEYKDHRNKKVYIYGDHSGKSRDPGRRKTLYESFFDVLRGRGWVVINKVQRMYPPYQIRYQVLNAILNGTSKTPTVKVNEVHAKDLIISIQNAPVVKDTFEKDKTSEQNENVDQRFATHFSDIFDYMIFKKFARFIPKLSSARSRVSFK